MLRDKRTSPASKMAAASALSQVSRGRGAYLVNGFSLCQASMSREEPLDPVSRSRGRPVRSTVKFPLTWLLWILRPADTRDRPGWLERSVASP